MSSAIVMPKVGLTMTEGKIVEWKKGVGDRVEKGETVFVFETEKVSYDVEAAHSGYLTRIIITEGETVPVGTEVALLGESPTTETARSPRPVPADASRASAPRAADVAAGAVAGTAIQSSRIRATPLARRIAKANGLDLAQVAAASPSARLKKSDIEQFLSARAARAQAAPARAAAPSQQGEGKLVKLTSMRDIIARKMLASTVEAAQTYMVVSVDAGNLVEARQRLINSIQKETGIRPTLTDLIAKIVAVAIARHPVMNTRWTPEGILWLDAIHMGIATALDDGLVVPVITDIGNKKLSAIAVERHDLIESARAGKLPPERMRGSTFTISSLGMFGVEEFTAIINQPESAILAIGAIVDTPVARDGAVVIRPIMKLTLTYDHRIIDGAKAATFVATLKDVIEEPLLALA
ncbi:MAG TPA: dihydrolipoamide acetyltransferase family protein [Pseudorhodoplanes sp.]|jgi:pyruvate dehydrogenase E2 component (dihydrolipoamide acetyltransferase)|nr:dihydrolipoamide acetyltransferase family protein [Pseudorhodoplanes sp.]